MKQGWESKKLGDVCDIVNGGTPKTSISEYWNGDNLWITPKDMGKHDSIYVEDTSRKITDEGMQNSSAKLFSAYSVVLSSRAPIGHLAINKKPISTNQGCKGIVPSDEINYLYLYYFLKNSVKLLNSLGSGTTFKELSSSKLKNVIIPIPPLEEQKQIVAKLDQCFEAIDKARANAAKNLENAKELFQSKLNDIFSQKGEGWVEKKLGDVCENLDSKRIPITKNKRTEGNIPYYGASGVVDHVNEYIFNEDLLLVSEDGANLLARTYPIAFSISGKTWVNNHAHVLKFQSMAAQRFIEYYLNSIKLDDYVSGMAQPKLNQRMLNSISVPNADEHIQKDVVSRLDELKEQTQSLESKYQQELNSLEELKKSILQKAFEGEL